MALHVIDCAVVCQERQLVLSLRAEDGWTYGYAETTRANDYHHVCFNDAFQIIDSGFKRDPLHSACPMGNKPKRKERRAGQPPARDFVLITGQVKRGTQCI